MSKNWTTSSGQKIRIKEMTDAHLRNTILFLKRKAKTMRRELINALTPSWYDSSDPRAIINEDEFDPNILFIKHYPNLKKEAKKRRLCVKLKCKCKSHPGVK